MSVLNNVVLLGSVLEENKQLNQINDWLDKNGHGKLVRFKDSIENSITKGEKVFTSFLCIGCFNYLDVDEFVNFLKNNVEWVYPECVRILIDNKGRDDGYELFIIDN